MKNNQLVNVGYQIMRNEGNPLSKDVIYNLLLKGKIINRDGTPTQSSKLTMNDNNNDLTNLKHIDYKMYKLVKSNAHINHAEMHRIDIDADVLQTMNYFKQIEIKMIKKQIFFINAISKYGNDTNKITHDESKKLNQEIMNYTDTLANIEMNELISYSSKARYYNLVFIKLIELLAERNHNSYLSTVAFNHFRVACRVYLNLLKPTDKSNKGLDVVSNTTSEATELLNEKVFKKDS